MTAETIIADYLERLDSALARSGCPSSRRLEFVREISEHIEQARAQLPVETEASVHEMLDRIGPPEDLATDALESEPAVKRGSPLLRRWFLVASVATVAVVVAVVLIVALSRPRTLSVPDVVGKRVPPGATVLVHTGLKTRVEVVHSTLPAGRVVDQLPPAGSVVVRGTVITLEESSGPPIRLPDVLNLHVATAVAELHRLGVPEPNIRIEQVPDSMFWPGRLVIGQTPIFGIVWPGTPITLHVSRGEPGCPLGPKAPSSTVAITMKRATSSFDRACYFAPAGRRLAIHFTNEVVALGDGTPTSLQLVISSSRSPSVAPVPGRPGFFGGTTAGAVVVGPLVRAPNTVVIRVRSLKPGTYTVEVLQFGALKSATLVVG